MKINYESHLPSSKQHLVAMATPWQLFSSTCDRRQKLFSACFCPYQSRSRLHLCVYKITARGTEGRKPTSGQDLPRYDYTVTQRPACQPENMCNKMSVENCDLGSRETRCHAPGETSHHTLLASSGHQCSQSVDIPSTAPESPPPLLYRSQFT